MCLFLPDAKKEIRKREKNVLFLALYFLRKFGTAVLSKKKKCTKNLQEGSQYGLMFSVALKEHGQLCIGLYRLHEQAPPESNKRYVITNPPANLILSITDYVSEGEKL